MRIGFALLLLLPLAARAREWKVDAAHSTLTFTGTYQDESFEGRFKRFDAKVNYDPGDLAHAKFDVMVDIASVDTANIERDQALPGKAFFDTAQFPRAHFVTTRFRKGANGQMFADGTLSLRGISKPVTLAVRFAQAGSGATLEVDTTLKRLDLMVAAPRKQAANAVSRLGSPMLLFAAED